MMSNNKLTLLIFSALAAIVSCSPSIRNIGTWVNKEKVQQFPQGPHAVFIAVLTQQTDSRYLLENDLARTAESKGLKAIKSLDVFGGLLTKETMPSKEALVQKIRNLGCDLILTVAVIDQHSETYYQPGSLSLYTPYPAYGYFGDFYGYSSVFLSPGYYETNNTYFLECNIYDSKSEALLVSMQTKAVNPKEIEKSSPQYTAALVQELQNQGFLKAKK